MSWVELVGGEEGKEVVGEEEGKDVVRVQVNRTN